MSTTPTGASRPANKDMVELDNMSDDDAAWLRHVLGRTLRDRLSGARGAARQLSRPCRVVRKVVPTDYRRALDAARLAEGEPETAAAIMMAAAHG